MSDLLKQKVNSILNARTSRGQQADELLDLYLAQDAGGRFEVFGAVLAAHMVGLSLLDALRRAAEKNKSAVMSSSKGGDHGLSGY